TPAFSPPKVLPAVSLPRSSPRRPPGATDNTSPRSRRSGGLRPPCSGPARPKHRPAATSRRSLQACIASLPLQSSLMSKTYLKSDHFNGGGSRMHSFGTVWWSSCLRFKRCTVVPNSSCRHLADFDDDTLAKTWLHDVNTTLGKGTQSFIGMPVSARHAEKGCLWALSSSLIFSRSRSVTSRLNREFSSWSSAIRSSLPRV